MAETLSIVIPVYRSASILPELYRQLAQSLDALTVPCEIIFVEDCGSDNSWTVIKELAERDPRVRGLKLWRNYGQHNATLCGIRAARYEAVVTMDDDLQHPPDQIPRLLAKLREGYDVVYGVPDELKHGLLRDLASRLTKIALQSAMGAKTARNVSAFRIFRTRLRVAFEDYRSPSVSIDVLLSWATQAFGAVRVRHEPRRSGSSSYTLAKLVNHAFNMVTGFSTLPLRMVSIIGFTFTLFGVFVLMWVLGQYLVHGSVVPGFVFLATIVALFSGVQLFAFGIIGEYLAVIFARSMEKPVYVVSEQTATGAILPLLDNATNKIRFGFGLLTQSSEVVALTSESLVIKTPALTLECCRVRDDEETFQAPIAALQRISVRDSATATIDYRRFSDWCESERIMLCSARVEQDRIVESMFLEDRSFRFIELNYRVFVDKLQSRAGRIPETNIQISDAPLKVRAELVIMAEQMFQYGRIHQDPRVSMVAANRRYAHWLSRAFDNPQQKVLQCVHDTHIIGFFVVESPSPEERYWSLVGLGPQYTGRGLGRQTWTAMMRYHAAEGVDKIVTSVSSHNTPMINLYAALGYRFPKPHVTLHWRPPGVRPLGK